MSITITIDGKKIQAEEGQTIMEAADSAGIYIPRLCKHKDLNPRGACRVCTVKVNGKPQAACVQTVTDGSTIEADTEELNEIRKQIVEMLLVEGNHFCMFCEKSGNCELQATAYRLGILSPRYPYLFPKRTVDATHKDIYLDRNRCILCGRCVNGSRDVDGKTVFEFTGRGPNRRISVSADKGLGTTEAARTDKAMEVCPVGCIIKKRVGFKIPVGKRAYDTKPIGSDVDAVAGKGE